MRYFHAVLVLGFTFLSINGFAQDGTPNMPDGYIPVLNNYIRTWDAKAPVTDPAVLTTRPVRDVQQTTNYIDGLGRSKQTVIKQGTRKPGTNEFQDLVTPVTYEYGRELRKYLPFVSKEGNGFLKFDPFQEQETFYNDANPNSPVYMQGETYFYSKIDFEPLTGNVRKVYPVGKSWVHDGKGQKTNYWHNTAKDNVKIWNVTDVPGGFGTYTLAGTYQANELYKSVTEDEHGKQVIEFKDKNGNVILKKVQLQDNANGSAVKDDGTGSGYDGWLSTYYIYDDQHTLRAVIQPKGVDLWRQGGMSTSLTTDILSQLCFRYEYDGRRRMTRKKVPGAGEVFMVYDSRDRLVFSQDAKMRLNNEWLTTLYDKLNRPVLTGLTIWVGTLGQLQDAVNYQTTVGGTSGSNGHFESVFEGMVVSNNPLPSNASFTLLTKTGYDTYNTIPGISGLSKDIDNYFTASNYINTAYGSFPYPEPIEQSFQTRGMVTWTQTKVLGTVDKFLYAIIVYDDKGRVIQIKSKNYTDAVDIATTQYSFAGQVLTSLVKHQKGGANPQSYEIVTKNSYDDLGRVVSMEKNLNGGGWKKVIEMTYDALGQAKSKKMSPDFNNGAGLETLTSDYNIRGWLLGSNREYAKSTSDHTHYFGFDLGYDNQTITSLSSSYTQAQYNGNIAGTVWKSKGDGEVRKYDFTYDPVNRLTGADFNQYTSGFNKSAGVDFSVSNLTYDANGNILSQTQKGLKGNDSEIIDQLTYKYKDNDFSNRLQNVIDGINDPQTKLGDFRSSQAYMTQLGTKTIAATDYDYDDNGNLILDNNKDIASIGYNHLNLPQTITIKNNKGSIEYVYDASGVKLKKVVHETGKPDKTTLYLFGIYEDDVLQFLPMEEGRVRPVRDANNNITAFTYDYFVKDHLGNVRMVLTEEQKQDQYPAATLEGDLATSTDAVFIEKNYYDINSAYVVNKSSVSGLPDYQNNNGNPPYNNNPNSNATANSEKLYKLNAATNKTGLGITLKVMAGDQINVYGKSYWLNTGGNYSEKFPVPVSAILDAFLGNPAMVGKGLTSSGITTPDLTSALEGFRNRTDNVDAPWGYINWIFFDEQFKFVGGDFRRVGANGVVKEHALVNVPSLKAPKNGYVFVYCSNESQHNVYFDNLQVFHSKGPLLEETHYYPFGLTMAGISSKALGFGNPENKKKYNGIEKEDGLGIEIYDAQLRELDPQLGRWWQIDPKVDKMEMWSPYASNYDNPIRYSDPLGDEGQSCCEGLKNWLGERWEAQKRGVWLAGKWIKEAAGQASENAKDNWNAGRDPIHQALRDPWSSLIGPTGVELRAVERALAVEGMTMKGLSIEINIAEDILKIESEANQGGKAANNLKPYSEATGDYVGDHVTFKRDINGNIYKYEEYKVNSKNPNGFETVKRFDGGMPNGNSGANHINKRTLESIPTPQVQGKDKVIPGQVRTPLPWEIPDNKRFKPTPTGS
jgi:RHS repeat-associated protein